MSRPSLISRIYSRITEFVRDAARGFEPVATRAGLAAFFVLLASFGIGSGALPPQVDAVLGFIAVAAPLVAAWKARAKVSPVHMVRDRHGLGG